MKLTPKELRIVLRAAELIVEESPHFWAGYSCCEALEDAELEELPAPTTLTERYYGRRSADSLRSRFSLFYRKSLHEYWFEMTYTEEQDARVLLLLLFAEACK